MSARRKARPTDTGANKPGPRSVGTCSACGKQMYRTRKEAKQALREAHPGEQMSVYPCGDAYHYGHLASRVKAGDTDRRDLRRGGAA